MSTENLKSNFTKHLDHLDDLSRVSNLDDYFTSKRYIVTFFGGRDTSIQISLTEDLAVGYTSSDSLSFEVNYKDKPKGKIKYNSSFKTKKVSPKIDALKNKLSRDEVKKLDKFIKDLDHFFKK